MSFLKMMKPADGIEGVKQFVLESIQKAGANPCPPIVVGIGIGGNFERCAEMAKEALLRDINDVNPDPILDSLEKELLTTPPTIANKLDPRIVDNTIPVVIFLLFFMFYSLFISITNKKKKSRAGALEEENCGNFVTIERNKNPL